MVYQWKPKVPYTFKTDAQTAGEICETLNQENRLSAETLVDISRPVDAPLHQEFEWDDGIAGEEWRKHQARHLLHSLVTVDDKAPTEPIRGFFKIERSKNTYESITSILQKPDKYAALLDTALSELKAFSRKYCAIKELAPVLSAIDEFVNKK